MSKIGMFNWEKSKNDLVIKIAFPIENAIADEFVRKFGRPIKRAECAGHIAVMADLPKNMIPNLTTEIARIRDVGGTMNVAVYEKITTVKYMGDL